VGRFHIGDRQWPYHFSDEDGDGDLDDETYNVIGWLRYNENSDGIDKKDTARNGVAARYRVPGNLLSSVLKLKELPLPAKAWVSGATRAVAMRHIEWSDVPETYDDGRAYRQRVTKSAGSLVAMKPDVLSSFLKQKKMDLIVSVHIERRLEEEYGGSYDYKAKKSRSHQEFFILRANGKIENFSGAIGSW
jgi:hypothetical protein